MPRVTPSAEVEAAEAVRSWVYGTLGVLFDSIPETLDWQEPPGGGYAGTRRAIQVLCRAFLAQPRAVMESEQVRLFVNAPGGVPAPPYAAYYLDGELLGPSCNWVSAQYRAQGLELDAGAGQPPDFLSTEFEFLYFLCRHQRAARLTSDALAFSAAAQAEADFFRDHLVRWLPRFAGDVARASVSGCFFGQVAELLTVFCAEEQGRLLTLAKPLVAPREKLAHGSNLPTR